ncbi:MAG: Ldh family oxidoreductase [Caldilineaceae bacterium]|nr:Ldh family oxidoreductase [Caldilineaceae bacterium]
MSDRIRIPADEMRTFIAALFQRLQVPADDAQTAADVLVTADLRGVESHGINNLWQYTDPLRAGTLNPQPNITLPSETGVTALVDGDGGMGLVVGVKAMDLCIAKAKEHGVGIATVRRSRHYGMAAYHAMRCLPHDMIGISLTNNAGIAIVPTYGNEPMLSTNPISVAVPTDKEIPYVLDMATSVVAFSKIGAALTKGEKIPLGWVIDDQGQPVDDSQAAWEGRRILPLGSTPDGSSHKGYGLAVLVDILTGVLSGGIYGNLAFRNPPEDPKVRDSSSHFFMAIRIDSFRPVDEFKATMDDMLSALRNSAKAPGRDRIYTHGEKEYEATAERSRLGIPYHVAFVKKLRELATEFDVPFSY